ncbi:MAG TPA: hypothetical protein VF519_07200 [Mycobacteriales bacterium]
MSARRDAQLRVRALHPPLPVLFALLREPGPDRDAALLAALRSADGWEAVQRFGDPWCPSPGCYGRDGAVLTGAAPPFADDCNCSVEPRAVR